MTFRLSRQSKCHVYWYIRLVRTSTPVHVSEDRTCGVRVRSFIEYQYQHCGLLSVSLHSIPFKWLRQILTCLQAQIPISLFCPLARTTFPIQSLSPKSLPHIFFPLPIRI